MRKPNQSLRLMSWRGQGLEVHPLNKAPRNCIFLSSGIFSCNRNRNRGHVHVTTAVSSLKLSVRYVISDIVNNVMIFPFLFICQSILKSLCRLYVFFFYNVIPSFVASKYCFTL